MKALRDYECVYCDITIDDFTHEDDIKLCVCCGKPMKKAYISAPNSNQLGIEGSNKSVAAMKDSFHHRFVKKEMDDVRHKHGVNFDNSLASAAVKRLKDGKS